MRIDQILNARLRPRRGNYSELRAATRLAKPWCRSGFFDPPAGRQRIFRMYAIAVVLPFQAARNDSALGVRSSLRSQPRAARMAKAIPYLAIEAIPNFRQAQIVGRSGYRIGFGRIILIGISQTAVGISEFVVELFFSEIAVVMCIREGLRSCARMVPIATIAVVARSVAITGVAVIAGGMVRFVW